MAGADMPSRAPINLFKFNTAQDIEQCANVCDMYIKKSTLAKVIMGKTWEAKLVDWFGKFADRKTQFQFVLALYTANETHQVNENVQDVSHK